MKRDDTHARIVRIIGLKTGAVLRGGALGGAAAAVVVTLTLAVVEPNLLPWWSGPARGTLQRVLHWTWAVLTMMPIGAALGVVTALICAVVFEYVARSAGWILGGVTGAALGLIGASVAGLLPWTAWWLDYRVIPEAAPLGASESTWLLLAASAASGIAGSIAGALYGVPRHRPFEARQARWRTVRSPLGGCSADEARR